MSTAPGPSLTEELPEDPRVQAFQAAVNALAGLAIDAGASLPNVIDAVATAVGITDREA